MSEALPALHALIDLKLGSVLLANMLAGWLDDNRESSCSVEAADEYEGYRATPEQDRLCVCASVDAGASPSPSGEYGAPVCPAIESPGAGLERATGPHSGPGSGHVGGTDNRPGRLQDPDSGCLDGAGGGSLGAGALTAGAFEFRLASIAGVVCANRHAGDRRRWLLQPGRFQRRPAVGIKGDDGPGRTSFVARAPPRWQAQ